MGAGVGKPEIRIREALLSMREFDEIGSPIRCSAKLNRTTEELKAKS
jgi:hypothetical protein